MMIVTPEHDLVSIGVLASRVRFSVRQIEAAADKLGIAPAWKINSVPHFTGEQVDRITAELRKRADQ